MPDRCFWCTDKDGKLQTQFAVIDVNYPLKLIEPVFIKNCPFCGRLLETKRVIKIDKIE